MYGLDDEETWYADFINGRGVEPQPSFIDHIYPGTGMFEQAVDGQRVCKNNLRLRREGMKEMLLKNGDEKLH